MIRPHKARDKAERPALAVWLRWPARAEGEVRTVKLEEHMDASIQVAQRASLKITSRNKDFVAVCLWSMLGLALTGLACTLGSGIEIGQALIVAG
jgi:hypothetical protein